MLTDGTPNPLEKPLYESFDNGIVLGQEIADLTELQLYELDELFHERIERLSSDLERYSEGQILTYSGIGYIAALNFFGNRVTVHQKTENSRGKITGLELRDKYDFDFYNPEFDQKSDENDDDEDCDVMIDDGVMDDGLLSVIKDWESELEPAPNNYRLYARFLVEHQTDIDYPVAGSAVVADSIKTLEYIDLSTVQLHDVSPEPEIDYFEVWRVPFALEAFAGKYRTIFKSKSFRRSSVDKQRNFLEETNDLMNNVLGLERFSVVLPEARVYTPVVEKGALRYEERELGGDLIAGCVKVDCIELQDIRNGKPMRKRKGNYNSNDSLCIVAEIDKDLAEFYELDSTIVWVPISSQIDDMELPVHPAL